MTPSRRTFLAAAAALVKQPSPAQPRPLIIDAHCHAGFGQAMTAPWTTRARIEVTLDHMAEAGIDKTVIFPVNDADYEKPNQAIAELCGRYSGKLIGYAKHDPETEQGRIRRLLRHEVEKLGLRGLKLHKHPTREVLDAVAELNVPILYHPREVSLFYGIAAAYPQVTLIMAHLGSYRSQNLAWHYEAIAIARRFPNVYLESSAVVALRFLEMAVKELGPEKVLFGSDGPENDSRVELYKIRLLQLPPLEEAKVVGGNIKRLLPKGSV
jgi:predicted TIM-barrel fold metal-dependent hydrolase